MYERSAIPGMLPVDVVSRMSTRPGDRKAEFAAQLGRHQGQLFGYIHSLVRDLDDADDLFQQTSLVLWDKFDQFDASRSFVCWACGVARYEVLNFLRREAAIASTSATSSTWR